MCGEIWRPNDGYKEIIRNAPDPMTAANLGRSRKVNLRDDWEQIKDQVMLKAVRAKFRTHPALRELLLSTRKEEIIENAPGDYYWGCGKDGNGKNILGKILVQIRGELVRDNQ